MAMRPAFRFGIFLCVVAQISATAELRDLSSADASPLKTTFPVVTPAPGESPQQLAKHLEARQGQIEGAKLTIKTANAGAETRIENPHSTEQQIKKLAAKTVKKPDPFAEAPEDDETVMRDHELDEQTRGVSKQVTASQDDEKDKVKKAARAIKREFKLKAKLAASSHAAKLNAKEVNQKCNLQKGSLTYAQGWEQTMKVTQKARNEKTVRRARRISKMIKNRAMLLKRCLQERQTAKATAEMAGYKENQSAKATTSTGELPEPKKQKTAKKGKKGMDRKVELQSVMAKVKEMPLYKEIDHELSSTVSNIPHRLAVSKKKIPYVSAGAVQKTKGNGPARSGYGSMLEEAQQKVEEAGEMFVDAKLHVIGDDE